MDLPAYVPPATEEAPVRESSASTLPPLVASLPPLGTPLYVAPRSSHPWGLQSVQGRAMAYWGTIGATALAVIVGGVAVGRHVARSSEEPSLHVLATGSGARVTASASGGAPLDSQPKPSTVDALPLVTGPAGVVIESTPVESLPRASNASKTRTVVAPVVTPRPVARAATTPAIPAPVAASPASSGIHAGDRDPSASNEPASKETATAPVQRVSEPESQAQPPADEATVDPLVKAVRDDIEEEESRHRQSQHSR
jgi:hypothetical protein